MATQFVTPPWGGLRWMLFDLPPSFTANDGLEFEGLFVGSPILLLSIPGFLCFWREKRAEALLLVSLLVVLWLPQAPLLSAVPRYLTSTIPLLGLGLAFWIDRFLLRQVGARRVLWSGLFVILTVWSTFNAACSLGTFWYHARIPRTWALASNLPWWTTLFPNGSLFLVIVITLTCCSLALFGIPRFCNRSANS